MCKVQANNSEWLKYYLSFMSKGDTARYYQFFCNFCQLKKIHGTNFIAI